MRYRLTLFIVSLVLALAACSENTHEELTEFEDPFPEGIETAFLEARIAIIASEALQHDRTGRFPSYAALIRIDPLVCDGVDHECLIQHLEQQSWAAETEEYESERTHGVTFFIRPVVDQRGCFVFSEPVSELEKTTGFDAEIEELSDATSVWHIFVYCVV